MFHFIYKTTRCSDGKYYIGAHTTNNLDDGYMGSGKWLLRSIRKHGRLAHKTTVLEFCLDRQSLLKRECELVSAEEIQRPLCMNFKQGGEGGWDYVNTSGKSEKGRALGRKNWRPGILSLKNKMELDKQFYDKCCLRLKQDVLAFYGRGGKTFEGKNHSDRAKELMSIAGKRRVGVLNSQFGTTWVTNGSIDKKIRAGVTIPDGFIRGRLLVRRNKKYKLMEGGNHGVTQS